MANWACNNLCGPRVDMRPTQVISVNRTHLVPLTNIILSAINLYFEALSVILLLIFIIIYYYFLLFFIILLFIYLFTYLPLIGPQQKTLPRRSSREDQQHQQVSILLYLLLLFFYYSLLFLFNYHLTSIICVSFLTCDTYNLHHSIGDSETYRMVPPTGPTGRFL